MSWTFCKVDYESISHKLPMYFELWQVFDNNFSNDDGSVYYVEAGQLQEVIDRQEDKQIKADLKEILKYIEDNGGEADLYIAN